MQMSSLFIIVTIFIAISYIKGSETPLDEKETFITLNSMYTNDLVWSDELAEKALEWLKTPDHRSKIKADLIVGGRGLVVNANDKTVWQKILDVLEIHFDEKEAERSPPIPWRKIITNRPFIAHLISTWILTNVVTVMMVYLPTYYKDVLLLGVIMNGLYSSLPMMFNFVFKLSWGVLVDRLKRRNVLTPTLGVKISQCFPTFGVAAGLIPVALLATCQRPVLALVLLCFTNMCFGAHTSGAYTSLLSLAPRFTPTLSSISVSVSMLAQLTTPFMVAAVVSIVR
ncbi:unnamed protein product [Haemonchus placei]|uniref:MFS domain-containing protein n=1 Tax=Haemonchus placei TaxID=6290 RepID=A0A0N4WAX7_HAEPC|nr:unnamed protein product [Haemonchus placei]